MQYGSAVLNADFERNRGRQNAASYASGGGVSDPMDDIFDPDERAYFKGVRSTSKGARTMSQGDGPVLGGNRPSMQALGRVPSGIEANEYAATMSRGNENERQARAFDRLDAVDTGMHAKDVMQNRQDNDLFGGQAARRSSALDAIRRQSQLSDVHGDTAAYFDRDATTMRESKQRDSMEALRRRYTDPAMIKADADRERQILQNQGRMGVADINQQGGNAREATAGRSRIGAAFATQGDQENASQYAPPMAPNDNAFPAERLQEFMLDNGIKTEDEARQILQMHGYGVR